MKTKRLGRTELQVPIVGLGAGFIGISSPNRAAVEYDGRPGGMVEELAIRTIHAAIESGSTLIDTAPLYGQTRSEEYIGKALKMRPDLAAKCTVTTKVGQLPEPDGRDYRFDTILKHVEDSQERLGIEQFEILYIHDAMDIPFNQVMGKRGALGALRKLQNEGITRFVGTAANDPPTNGPFIETGEFDAAVVPEAWSLINQLAADRILPAAEQHDVGLVIATPVERGLLATGPVANINYLARDFSQTCLDHVAKIQELCNDHKVPMVAAALQWCTRHPQVATTIPGARTPEEAAANANAGSLDIPEAFWDNLGPLVVNFKASVHR